MQRHRFMFLVASIAAVVLLGCSHDIATATPADELRRLTVEQVAAYVAAKDGKTFIYDDNSKDSWAQGHVPSATWLDSDNVTAKDLPADKSARLIFYCHDEG